MSNDFDQDWSEDSNTITFKIDSSLNVTKATYTYYIQAFNDEDSIVTTSSYVFSTICGASTFTFPEIDTITEWTINNTIPILKLPQFFSYSNDCSIEKYQLYSDNMNESPAFETTYDMLNDTSEIQFSLQVDLKNIKAAYTYIMRASDITDSTDVIFEIDN